MAQTYACNVMTVNEADECDLVVFNSFLHFVPRAQRSHKKRSTCPPRTHNAEEAYCCASVSTIDSIEDEFAGLAEYSDTNSLAESASEVEDTSQLQATGYASHDFNVGTSGDADECELELVVQNSFLHAVPLARRSEKRRSSCPPRMHADGEPAYSGSAKTSAAADHWYQCGSDGAVDSHGDEHSGYANWTDTVTSTNSSAHRDDDVQHQMGHDGFCTVMVKNMPCRCKPEELRAAITDVGCGGGLDFLHIPVKRGHRTNCGYAFAGFTTHAAAVRFRERMSGYRFGSRSSDKVVEVVPAHIQGKDGKAHVADYGRHNVQTLANSQFLTVNAGCAPTEIAWRW